MQMLTQSLGIARQPAWAAISTAMHLQLQQLVRETAAHVGTQLAVHIPIDLKYVIDQPILGLTLPRWLHNAELLEMQRTIRAMKSGLALGTTPMEAFTQNAPFSQSNSSVSAATVTAATAVLNRTALEIFKLAEIKRYTLATNGTVRDPMAYKLQYGVDEDPRAPMHVGDRSYPVPA